MRPDAGLALPFLGPPDLTRATRARVDLLSEEMSTGRSSDVGRALSSDFSTASRLAHDMHRLDAISTSLSRAATWGTALQTALGGMDDAVGGLVEGLAGALAAPPGTRLNHDLAENALRDISAMLDRTVGGRAVFANGAATGPLSNVDGLMSDVRAMAAGASDYASYAAAVDAHFAAGGAFEANHLTIANADPVRFPAGDAGPVAFDLDGGAEEIVAVISQLALAAGLSDANFPVSHGSAAIVDVHGRIAGAAGGLPELRGRLGAIEHRVDDLAVQVREARVGTEMALADTVGIDMFEAASKLQNEMSRLESLYAITARRARLRLTDYL